MMVSRAFTIILKAFCSLRWLRVLLPVGWVGLFGPCVALLVVALGVVRRFCRMDRMLLDRRSYCLLSLDCVGADALFAEDWGCFGHALSWFFLGTF